MVDDNRAIFMFRDGSQAWEAKNFLIEQERCLSVTIENKVYPGIAHKDKVQYYFCLLISKLAFFIVCSEYCYLRLMTKLQKRNLKIRSQTKNCNLAQYLNTQLFLIRHLWDKVSE